MGPKELVPLYGPVAEVSPPDATVEIMWIAGRVLYSTDMAAAYARVSGGSSLENSLTAGRDELKADLEAMDWEPLSETRVLDEWDMVWTGKDGRLEIELVPDSQTRSDRTRIDLDMTVIDDEGRVTARRRLPPQGYLILHPEFYGAAKVKGVLGTVLVARNRDQVKEFFAKYRWPMRVVAEPDKATLAKKQEFLRSPTLK